MRRLLLAGSLILLLGFGVIIVGSLAQAGTSTGGAIFIGPFPIVFGSGPNGSSLAVVSLAMGAVMVALVMLWGWRMFGRSGGDNG